MEACAKDLASTIPAHYSLCKLSLEHIVSDIGSLASPSGTSEAFAVYMPQMYVKRNDELERQLHELQVRTHTQTSALKLAQHTSTKWEKEVNWWMNTFNEVVQELRSVGTTLERCTHEKVNLLKVCGQTMSRLARK